MNPEDNSVYILRSILNQIHRGHRKAQFHYGYRQYGYGKITLINYDTLNNIIDNGILKDLFTINRSPGVFLFKMKRGVQKEQAVKLLTELEAFVEL
jgi:hypothetical protein